MKKLDNFANCLDVLKGADFANAENDPIYRTGVVAQFNITFELAWKALQEILKLQGVLDFKSGSPRDVLQLGFKVGMINDSAVWLNMLTKRNISVHIYDEAEIDQMILLIRDSFIPAFVALEKALREKLNSIRDDSL